MARNQLRKFGLALADEIASDVADFSDPCVELQRSPGVIHPDILLLSEGGFDERMPRLLALDDLFER